jgi:hypothetical protein
MKPLFSSCTTRASTSDAEADSLSIKTAKRPVNLQVVLKQSTQKAVQSIHVTSGVAPKVQNDASVCSHLANHGVHFRRGEREFRNFDYKQVVTFLKVTGAENPTLLICVANSHVNSLMQKIPVDRGS